MKIKGADGHEYNVTGQGQGNFNTVGAAGGIGWIAEKLTGGNLGNIFGNNCNNDPSSVPVSRYEMGLIQTIAAKDSKIGLLESNSYTDSKIADVYERLNVKIDRNREEQNAINLQQAVYNGVNTAAVECIKGQIAALQGLTKLVVPITAVCPQPAVATTTTTAGA